MGVQCNARAPTEHLVLHHHVLCWLPLTWSPCIGHVYKVSSSLESLYAVWAVLELTRSIGYSQTAPRHEKPLEAGQVLALLPGRGRTYKQDNSFAHCLHWNAGNSVRLSKPSYRAVIPSPESSCILGPWVPTCSGVSVHLQKRCLLSKHSLLLLQFLSFAQAGKALSFSRTLESLFLLFIVSTFIWSLVSETQKPEEAPLSLLLVSTSFP